MKTAIYDTLSSENFVVEYDEEAPCRICGKPVVEASMSGTDVCPWCDCGKHRDRLFKIETRDSDDGNILIKKKTYESEEMFRKDFDSHTKNYSRYPHYYAVNPFVWENDKWVPYKITGK